MVKLSAQSESMGGGSLLQDQNPLLQTDTEELRRDAEPVSVEEEVSDVPYSE